MGLQPFYILYNILVWGRLLRRILMSKVGPRIERVKPLNEKYCFAANSISVSAIKHFETILYFADFVA